MNLSDVLSHTPLWVWVLLAFVLSRGIAALRPREVAAQRALILPLVFLVWGLTSLVSSRGPGFDALLFVAAGVIGVLVGAGVAWLSPAPILKTGGVLIMPGSFVPLVLIVAAFPIKYALAVAIATAGAPAEAAFYASLGAAVGGLFAGLFWGRTLTQFRRALDGARWPAVAALALTGTAPVAAPLREGPAS
jgi:hypothetical protein